MIKKNLLYFLKIKFQIIEQIKCQIIKNPKEAKLLFERNNIKNNLYYFLTIFLNSNINVKNMDLFFLNEIKKNIRSIFNYYNYIVQYSRPYSTIEELNKYFHAKNLLHIRKVENDLPLYIDNIKGAVPSLNSVKSSKKVSIVMTIYNEEELISHALKSLFNQTYQNFNVIVVNDGSIGGISEKLFEEKKIYGNRLRIITLKENVGTYVAKNIGITYADGELISFHDSDDWAHPQRIEEHVNAHMENKKVKFSISKLVRITEDGVFYSKHVYPLDRLSMVSLMIDRSLLDEVGYFRKQRIGSDTEYFERLKRFTEHKFSRIDKVLMFCSHRENSLTTSSETGVDGFSTTSKRKHHWNKWNKWHNMMRKVRRTPFIDFNRNNYDYKIIE